MDWTIDRNIKQAELNPDQVQFVRKTAQLVKQKSKNLHSERRISKLMFSSCPFQTHSAAP
jgi:hypothetical protein